MKLDKIFNDINNNKELWNYYKYSCLEKIYPTNDSLEFIKQFLSYGGKYPLIKDIESELDKLNEESKYRFKHTLSVYMLGIHIYDRNNKIKTKIDEKVEYLETKYDKESSPINNVRLYIWFLTALYHDIGYAYEENSNKYLNDTNDEIIGCINQNKKIKLKNYKDGCNYYRYRKCKFKKIDHGVIGGIKLYLGMSKIMRQVGNEKKTGLIYDTNLKIFFKEAASSIIRHNIWACRSDDIEKKEDYQGYNLKKYITSKNSNKNKLRLEDDPFAFLLALCDTIDPVKNFRDRENDCLCQNSESIEKHISFDVNENSIIITVDELVDYNEYLRKIKELMEWLVLDVEEEENRVFIKLLN